MPTESAQESHLCLDCGTDISDRRRDAQRCEDCAYVWTKERAKNHYRENREKVLQRVKSRQQTSEYKQSRREWEQKNPEKLLGYRQRERQKQREKTDYKPEGRTCEDCHADISKRGHRAKKCESCSRPPVRVCIACDAVLQQRRRLYCNEQCKQDAQRLKELKGYTKTCTKCNETKEHTEFGMHYNLRRSVCKMCEVQSQSERYCNLTPEQRERRRRLRRGRERIKRTSLSSAERAMQKTKAREALMRNRFGDFDEYAEYLKQDGKCAICGIAKPFKKDATVSDCLEVDHDHGTNRPRGLLCKNCNFKLVSQYEKRFPPYRQDSPHLNAYLSKGQQQ